MLFGIMMHKSLAGHPAPRWQIVARAGIGRVNPDHLARRHLLHEETQLNDEVAATEVAGVPFAMMFLGL